MAEVNAQPAGKRMPTPVTATSTATNAQADAGALQGENAGAGEGEGEGDIEIDPARTVEVRILRNHCDYVANTLELVTPAEANSGQDDWCDGHEDAVAYMKGEAA